MLFTPPPFPSGAQGSWGRGEGRFAWREEGTAFLRQCRPGRKRRVDLTGSECATEPFLSEEERNRRHSSAQNQEGEEAGSREAGPGRRGALALLGAHGVELSAPRRFPRLGPGPRAGAGGSSLPFKTLFPVLLHHAPSDWAPLARRPCNVPCRRRLSPVGPPWNRPQLRRPSRPPSLTPEPHASTHRALARVGGWPLSEQLRGRRWFQGRRARELTQQPRPRGPHVAGGASG